MSRIDTMFNHCKDQSRAALAIYTMAYDSSKEVSSNILEKLPDAGVDLIELGIPFSDPMADGKTIQQAALRAFDAGATLDKILNMVREFRTKNSHTPIVLMGYYNPILHYGVDAFAKAATNAGVDGLLIVDVPLEEDETLYNACESYSLACIKLITPTTNDDRIKRIAERSSGFIYYVSVAGVTGEKSATSTSIGDAVSRIKAKTSLPVAVGFGVKDEDSARQVGKHADMVVVGSAFVDTLQSSSNHALSFATMLAASLK